MSSTRIINSIKYLQHCNDNNLKSLTLEDNVYFTLRELFYNMYELDYIMEANVFINEISGSICYEDRKSDFKYKNSLHDKLFVDRLNKWLNHIKKSEFEFEEPYDKADDEEKYWYYDMKLLINFDDWWSQFEELKVLIKNRLDELKDI
jgi:hypothetical protein